MDHQLIPAVEDENDRLQEPTTSVETEPKLTRRTVIVEVLDSDCPRGRLNDVFT